MRTIITDDFSKPFCEHSVVTIGNFDGVHKGHRELFRQITSLARSNNVPSVVVTFNPHPLRVLQPDNQRFCLITTFEQKCTLIAESNPDLLLVIPFTPDFSKTPAEEFVKTVLHRFLGVQVLVIGHDYAFGKGREGNEKLLASISGKYGFRLIALDPVTENGLVFSSSLVRRLVEAGDVAGAIAVLGRYHRVAGQVVPGRKVGRILGFPTANIAVTNELVPADGVYAVLVELAGRFYQGACSIGKNPTFGGDCRTVEVFLLDFDGDLYNKELVLHFIERLRSPICFDGVEQLMAQIQLDVERCRALLQVACKNGSFPPESLLVGFHPETADE